MVRSFLGQEPIFQEHLGEVLRLLGRTFKHYLQLQLAREVDQQEIPIAFAAQRHAADGAAGSLLVPG